MNYKDKNNRRCISFHILPIIIKVSNFIQYSMYQKRCVFGQIFSQQNPKTAVKYHIKAQSQKDSEEVTRLFIPEKDGCKKGKDVRRDYEYSSQGVKTIRMIYKREESFRKVEFSSRETTHRSAKEPLSQFETNRIRLFLSKIQSIVIQEQIKPFWKIFKTTFNGKIKKSSSKNPLQKWETLQIGNKMGKCLAILSFPLLSCKIDEIKATFLGRLQLLHQSHTIRPYQAAIIFLLIRFQSRQNFLHLRKAFASLKLNF